MPFLSIDERKKLSIRLGNDTSGGIHTHYEEQFHRLFGMIFKTLQDF